MRTMPRPLVNTGHRLPRGGDRCDFCGESHTHKLYACKNFTWEGRAVFDSDVGRFTACLSCARLIDQKLWRRVSTRVLREVSKRKGIDADQLKHLAVTLKTLHKTFGANLINGEALGVLTPKYIKLAAGV